MNKLHIAATGLFLLLLTGCQTKGVSENQRFEASIRKEIPFRVDSMHWITGGDMATFQFSNQDYVTALPDVEINADGTVVVYSTLTPTRQSEEKIWRNVVVSRKNRRVVCIDRYMKNDRTHGYVYVLQSESKDFPTFGKYHWDVSDSHNIESTGMALNSLDKLAVKRLKGDDKYVAPASQDDYWALLFHADSLFAEGLYAEAKQLYDLAFTEDRYILPSQLSTVACKMQDVGDDNAALKYLNHRVQMEKDFYENPSMCSFSQLKDTFELRQKALNYNLPLKEKLEWIFERDQYDRMIWSLTAQNHPEQTHRVDMLAARAWDTDSTNLIMVNEVLSESGFPRKSQVGEFAVLATWLVFQHSDLEHQKLFLPLLEEAARNGDIAPAYVAVLKDRIDIREGRPQKYGSQRDADGKLCPLLDASRVNEWRQEVGLPRIE